MAKRHRENHLLLVTVTQSCHHAIRCQRAQGPRHNGECKTEFPNLPANYTKLASESGGSTRDQTPTVMLKVAKGIGVTSLAH